MMDPLLPEFAELFSGQGRAYGGDSGLCIREPVTPQVLQDHLDGVKPVGIYPMVEFTDQWRVHWGCVDIDTNDLELALNLQLALDVMRVRSWVEVSRSKGYHVWVFAREWVPAKTMRAALMAACQIVGYSPKEVNPKQESLPEGKLGNYVRLPYPNYGRAGRQIVFSETGQPLEFAAFVTAAHKQRVSFRTLEEAAELWKPPPPKQHVVFGGEPDESIEDLCRELKRRSHYGYVIFTQGPLEGGDRSGTMYRLAVRIRDAHFKPSETLALLRDYDRRYGKFSQRADGEQRLQEMVERVYGG